jgi:hypothetical protein
VVNAMIGFAGGDAIAGSVIMAIGWLLAAGI